MKDKNKHFNKIQEKEYTRLYCNKLIENYNTRNDLEIETEIELTEMLKDINWVRGKKIEQIINRLTKLD